MNEPRWDCHEHRDELKISNAATIYHPQRGQLCYGIRNWDCWLYHPLVFKDKAAAQKWIETGYIAEIQESLGILDIGFRTNCFRPRQEEATDVEKVFNTIEQVVAKCRRMNMNAFTLDEVLRFRRLADEIDNVFFGCSDASDSDRNKLRK